MTLKYTVAADAQGHLLAVRARIVGDTGAYASTGGKCLLRAGCHATGVYRVPNVDILAKAVFTNNPVSGAMRGFGSNQAQFAMEGIMDMLAERVGVDGYDIRERNIMSVGWDKEPGFHAGETWASRGSALTSAAASKAAKQLAEDLKHSSLEELAGREYKGDYVCNFTTRPGTPEAKIDPTTHLTFSYATQVVILDDDGRLKQVVAAHD